MSVLHESKDRGIRQRGFFKALKGVDAEQNRPEMDVDLAQHSLVDFRGHNDMPSIRGSMLDEVRSLVKMLVRPVRIIVHSLESLDVLLVG